MAIMHDYVRRANFTTKICLQGKFSEFALFVRGYSFQIYCLRNSFMQNFTISKLGLVVKFAHLTSTCIIGIQL